MRDVRGHLVKFNNEGTVEDLKLDTVDCDGVQGGEVDEREGTAVVGVEVVFDDAAQEVIGIEEGGMGRFVDVDGPHGFGLVIIHYRVFKRQDVFV